MKIFKTVRNVFKRTKQLPIPPSKTKYFVNCKGIFQGGGAKAIAYVGAYEEAKKRGVGFSEFAGTSAGSMIAALLAAGATPQQLKDIIANTDFSSLKPKNGFKSNFSVKCLSQVLKLTPIDSLLIHKISKIIIDLGLYDSSPIIGIMESSLHKVINKDGDILFEDLKYPLTIVAVDLLSHEKVVWKKSTHPKKKIAEAVRASCNIPFYFMPVNRQYVDGGMLCNLPITEFNDTSYDFDRLLAFSYVYDKPKLKNSGIKNYLVNLAGTIVHGSTEIQRQLVGNTPFVLIKTDVDMLDFDKLNGKGETSFIRKAYSQGAIAMKSFLDGEDAMERNVLNRVVLLNNKEQVRAQISYYTITPTDTVVISMPDLLWVFSMYLYLIKLKNDHTEVHVFTETSNKKALRILNHMGIMVSVSYGSIPAYGYFFKKKSIWSGISVKCDSKNNIALAKNLNSEMDSSIIESLLSSIYTASCRDVYPQSVGTILLNIENESVCCQKLQSLQQFAAADIAYENIKISDLSFTNQYVHGYQYRAIEILVNAYAGRPLFTSSAFQLANGKMSNTVPIIAIEIDGRIIVVKGIVRLMYCFRNNIDTVRMIVIRNYQGPLLYQRLYSIQDVVITDRSTEANYTEYNRIDNELRKTLISTFQPMRTYLK